jgi:hypothetical protein
MKRRLITAILALSILGIAPASGHEKFRIIGKISRVSSSVLDVKQTKDGKVIFMFMPAKVTVTRDKTKRSIKDLKAGLSVVVDAIGDDLDDLEVVSVRIVPDPAKKP